MRAPFTERRGIFTENELREAPADARGYERLAVRFAAKLAARNALGGVALRWREIEVVGERRQPPALRVHGRAAECFAQQGIVASALSLTHDGAGCIGQVVLEGS